MGKRILFLLIFLSAMALGGQVDTTKVGPGVVYYSEYREAGPWHFDIIEVDLTNPWIKLKTVTANDKLGGHERTSSMANRNDSEGHRVVGAINGDFYAGNGHPIGTQLIDGEFLKSNTDWGSIAFSGNNKPILGFLNYSGTLWVGDSVTSIHGINRDRLDNEVILYNDYMGSSTATNQWGAEVRVKPLGSWAANDTMAFEIVETEYWVGNMSLDDSTVVLGGHGKNREFFENNAVVGDTVKFVLNLAPGIPNLTQLIGGNRVIVENGQVAATGVDRHPRTAAGFNADSTKLYLFTVDGRQAGYSVGMNYGELANYMIEWGVHTGINLDGGGSTTMWVRGQIKNSPSDAGGERSVSNSLLVVSTAPTGPLGHLRIDNDEIYLLTGEQHRFYVKGFDEHFNPVTVPNDALVWSCDPAIGSIEQNGMFTAGTELLNGYVYVEYNGITDTAVVRLTKVNKIELSPAEVVLQNGQYQQMTAKATDTFGNSINLTSSAFTWEVFGGVGTISGNGYFHATTEGTGQIKASYDDVSGYVEVSVGVSQYISVDEFNNTENYSLSGLRVNIDECSLTASDSQFVSPPTSGRLQYSLTTGGTSVLYLNCDIAISGSPDKIGLYVFGDGKGHWLRSEFADADGEKFLLNLTDADPGITWTNTWQYIEKKLEDAEPSWANPSAVLDFPITWTKIYLAETDDASKDDGVIYLDNLKFHYIATDVKEIKDGIPNEFMLFNNYPNPFNPSTKLRFAVAERSNVELSIYNTLGELVERVVSAEYEAGSYELNYNAKHLTSGIYFVRMKAGSFVSTNKMILLK